MASDHELEESTAFGNFLFQRRISQGRERISDYLQDKSLPFSDNYYRDVEAGRKRLSVEAMLQLHDAFKLSESGSLDYFWHYFKDVLPPAIHQKLFGKRTASAARSLEEINNLRDYDAKVLRRALAIGRYESEFVAGDEVLDTVQARFELLPLMHYVYMVEAASRAELRLICKNIGVDFDSTALAFVKGVAREVVRKGKSVFERLMPTLRMPRNQGGLRLKRRFTLHEVQRSLEKPECSEYFTQNGTFSFSSLTALRAVSLPALQNRIVDLMAELDVASKSGDQLESPDAEPYFFSLVVSGRPEYDGRKARS